MPAHCRDSAASAVPMQGDVEVRCVLAQEPPRASQPCAPPILPSPHALYRPAAQRAEAVPRTQAQHRHGHQSQRVPESASNAERGQLHGPGLDALHAWPCSHRDPGTRQYASCRVVQPQAADSAVQRAAQRACTPRRGRSCGSGAARGVDGPLTRTGSYARASPSVVQAPQRRLPRPVRRIPVTSTAQPQCSSSARPAAFSPGDGMAAAGGCEEAAESGLADVTFSEWGIGAASRPAQPGHGSPDATHGAARAYAAQLGQSQSPTGAPGCRRTASTEQQSAASWMSSAAPQGSGNGRGSACRRSFSVPVLQSNNKAPLLYTHAPNPALCPPAAATLSRIPALPAGSVRRRAAVRWACQQAGAPDSGEGALKGDPCHQQDQQGAVEDAQLASAGQLQPWCGGSGTVDGANQMAAPVRVQTGGDHPAAQPCVVEAAGGHEQPAADATPPLADATAVGTRRPDGAADPNPAARPASSHEAVTPPAALRPQRGAGCAPLRSGRAASGAAQRLRTYASKGAHRAAPHSQKRVPVPCGTQGTARGRPSLGAAVAQQGLARPRDQLCAERPVQVPRNGVEQQTHCRMPAHEAVSASLSLSAEVCPDPRPSHGHLRASRHLMAICACSAPVICLAASSEPGRERVHSARPGGSALWSTYRLRNPLVREQLPAPPQAPWTRAGTQARGEHRSH